MGAVGGLVPRLRYTLYRSAYFLFISRTHIYDHNGLNRAIDPVCDRVIANKLYFTCS